jgi:hypothetical protein
VGAAGGAVEADQAWLRAAICSIRYVHTQPHIASLPWAPTGCVDYVVDALALHDQLGEALRPAFTSPHITKVRHSFRRRAGDVLYSARGAGCAP